MSKKNTEISIIPQEILINKIFFLRNEKVMLDRDLAVKIIELFVKLREMLVSHTELKLEIERVKKKIDNHDKNIEIVFRYFDELLEQKAKPRKLIGFPLPKKKKR